MKHITRTCARGKAFWPTLDESVPQLNIITKTGPGHSSVEGWTAGSSSVGVTCQPEWPARHGCWWCCHSRMGHVRVPHCTSYTSLAALEACCVVRGKHEGRACDTRKTGCYVYCPATQQHSCQQSGAQPGWGASEDVHDSTMGEWWLQGPTKGPLLPLWSKWASLPWTKSAGVYYISYYIRCYITHVI